MGLLLFSEVYYLHCTGYILLGQDGFHSFGGMWADAVATVFNPVMENLVIASTVRDEVLRTVTKVT